MDDTPFTCLACAQRFSDADQQREHFKLEWHRHNLKRKLAGVPPISQDVFDRRRIASGDAAASSQAVASGSGSSVKPSTRPDVKTVYACKPCKVEFGSLNSYQSHARSKKHLKAVTAAGESASASPEVSAGSNAADAPDAVDEPVIITRSKSVPEPSKEEDETMGGEGGQEEVALTPNHCVFCNELSPDVAENLRHMAVKHSFFVPDVRYLSDAEGLVAFLLEKVHAAQECVTCNAKNRSGIAVQRHMADKGHHSIPYDTEGDMEVYDEFYDYSAALPGPLLARATRGAKTTIDEGEDEEDWSEGDDDESYDETIDGTDADASDRPRASISASGELVLPDGRVIGHRQYLRYYKQRYSPEDTRQSVVATKLSLEYQSMGNVGATSTSSLILARGQHQFLSRLSMKSRAPDKAFERAQKLRDLRVGVTTNKLIRKYFRIQMMQ